MIQHTRLDLSLDDISKTVVVAVIMMILMTKKKKRGGEISQRFLDPHLPHQYQHRHQQLRRVDSIDTIQVTSAGLADLNTVYISSHLVLYSPCMWMHVKRQRIAYVLFGMIMQRWSVVRGYRLGTFYQIPSPIRHS